MIRSSATSSASRYPCQPNSESKPPIELYQRFFVSRSVWYHQLETNCDPPNRGVSPIGKKPNIRYISTAACDICTSEYFFGGSFQYASASFSIQASIRG